jgi:RNA polymerase sigma-70 factor (ECF subfamily)
MNAARKEQVDWELALVQRASRGDVRAFERLYRENVGRVYGLCLRLTRHRANAEDCTQEAFINAWRSLERFESRSAFGTWLHRIAVNVVIGRRRSGRGVEAGAPASIAPSNAELSDEPCVFDSPVEEAELERAIEALPEGARDVLVLSGIYGYTHAEVAEMLGVAEGTCKAQLHRARSLLQTRLRQENSP